MTNYNCPHHESTDSNLSDILRLCLCMFNLTKGHSKPKATLNHEHDGPYYASYYKYFSLFFHA